MRGLAYFASRAGDALQERTLGTLAAAFLGLRSTFAERTFSSIHTPETSELLAICQLLSCLLI